MTADEIREDSAQWLHDLSTVPDGKLLAAIPHRTAVAQVRWLAEIAAQLAEQNDCSRAIVALSGDAKKRDADNIARVAKLDEDLQKARAATEEIAQKYWKLAAETEQAKRDLWRPRPTTEGTEEK